MNKSINMEYILEAIFLSFIELKVINVSLCVHVGIHIYVYIIKLILVLIIICLSI